MTEADDATYQDFRQYIIDNYTFARLVDDTGSEVTVLDIPNDSRISWQNGNTSNPITLSLTVDGGDADISLPSTVARIELYATSSTSTRRFSDPVTNATLEASGDTLTLTTDVEVPII